MSQNKTVVPGMEDYNSGNNKRSTEQNLDSFFKGKTVVPGMDSAPASNVQSNKSGKPIVGFLYSVSRSPAGEFWPLHVGSNTIGRSQDCDIVLSEGTVSEHHAELVVRWMKNPEKLISSVKDGSSTCGSSINGESLGFDARECFNMDRITIGESYELLIILIDTKKLGLDVSKSFIKVETEADDFDFNNNQFVFQDPIGRSAGTINVDNPTPLSSTGGTKIM